MSIKMNNLIFFTKYTIEGPSSRYRTFQYLPYFEGYFSIKCFPLFDKKHSKKGGIKPSIRLFYFFIKRIFYIFKYLFSNNIYIIEYELFPYLPPIFEFLLKFFNKKFILDYDDAIFHNYDNHSNYIVRLFLKNKIPYISKNAKAIISGSSYLTNYFLRFNKNVFQIPTSVNFSIYKNKQESIFNNNFITIGWIGSKSTSSNLLPILDVFHVLAKNHSNLRFLFCGFDKDLIYKFENISSVQFIDWSDNNEFIFLNSIDIGIMPLINNLFNNGKCGFKLIQYMAMGKPTISTPLQSNIDIDHNNGNLFAITHQDWIYSIELMLNKVEYFKQIGEQNIKTISKYYSCESNYSKYIEIFNSI